MNRIFDGEEKDIEEYELAIKGLCDLSLLEKRGCFTVIQCAALLCTINETDRSNGTDEDMGAYILLIFHDLRLGKLQVLHPETLLAWMEYSEMLKGGMYCNDTIETFPIPSSRWLIRLEEFERWTVTKGFSIDFSGLKSELEGIMKKAVSTCNSGPKDAVIIKESYQSSEDNCFSEDECMLFDPLTMKQIERLFTTVPDDDWEKFFDKALRNGLASARHGEKPYKYNPGKVANWLYRKGKYRPNTLARILSENLPVRSRQRRELFLESRGLLDEN